jgi:LacI family transcriptional regulator
MREARYHDTESVRRATAELMDLPDPPTAIMFPDDISFLGGQAELQIRGLSVPDDISVCGYDGTDISQMLQPPLTTWHQDAERIGKESVRKLVEAIEHRDTCMAEQIMVSGELISGYSVKKREN